MQNSEEFGEWIAHDGGGCPVRGVGLGLFQVRRDDGRQYSPGYLTIYDDATWERGPCAKGSITHYRLRK